MDCFNTGGQQEDFVWTPSINVSDCNCSWSAHLYLPECDCPYPDPPPIGWSELLPPGIAYGLVFLVGTIGNLLVIFVVNHYKNMHNVTNIFLASLSTADLCLIWFCVPIQYLKFLSFSWELGEFLCHAVHYVQKFTMICSVLTLTTISIERYVAIAHPMKSLWLSSIGRAKKIVGVIWLSAAFLASPTAARITYAASEPDWKNRTAYWCLKEFPKYWAANTTVEFMEQVYALYQFNVFLVLPLCTMAYCYARIACVVFASARNATTYTTQIANPSTAAKAAGKRSSRSDSVEYPLMVPTEGIVSGKPVGVQRRGTTGALVGADGAPTIVPKCSAQSAVSVTTQHKKTADANKKQLWRPSLKRQSTTQLVVADRKYIVHMLIAIVIFYIICWSPTIVDELLIGFGVICGTSITQTLKYMRVLFSALEYTQSCINPIVYAFLSANFRQSFIDAIRGQSSTRRRNQMRMENQWRCNQSIRHQQQQRNTHQKYPYKRAQSELACGKGTVKHVRLQHVQQQCSLDLGNAPYDSQTAHNS